jgi:hypothetical protein
VEPNLDNIFSTFKKVEPNLDNIFAPLFLKVEKVEKVNM